LCWYDEYHFSKKCYNIKILILKNQKMRPNKNLIFITLFSLIIFLIFIFFRTNILSKKNVTPLPGQLYTQNHLTKKNCPDGFILVPGNALYNTSNFCIMKYEAKCAYTSNPKVGLEPSHGNICSGEKNEHYYNTYNNSGKNCACAGDKEIVSTPSGFPITYITQSDKTPNNAKNYCASRGWHLITNNEWMTIARNVEQVPNNWCNKDGTNCGFTPGTIGKILANGHNDNKNEISANGTGTDSALVAGTDNQPCFETTTDGSNTCGGKNSQKRTLTLSNKETIWDFAGNVWEWTDNTIMRKEEPQSSTNGKRDLGWLKSDFSPGSLPSVLIDNGKGNAMGYNSFRPSNPTWNANNGVGRIYHYGSLLDTDTTLYAFIRGGNWKHGEDDGAFTIHLSPPPDRPLINDVGFRCVD
jgi:hypothetical protein